MPEKAVQIMLWLANAGAGDLVVELGCGEPLAAAAERRFGAQVRSVAGDFLGARIGDATVVVLCLPERLNLELRPKLQRELRPGTRVVSYRHGMGDWKPELTAWVRSAGADRALHVWTVR